jgi:NAD+ kinase
VSLQRIAIVVHPSRDVHLAVAAIRDWARGRGIEVVQLRTERDEAGHAPEGSTDGAGLVVAIGGDGTVLAALRAAAGDRLPVLGVACGSLGALTTVPAGEVPAALDAFASGDWVAQHVPALEVQPSQGPVVTAINDVVAVRAGGGQVGVDVVVDGELYGRFSGDGVIVSTQLGSSAYALAAGGPLLAPGSDTWLVTPLAPHGGCIPPLVLGAASQLRLIVTPGYHGARVEVDGQPSPIAVERLDIRLRNDLGTLVRVGEEQSFLTGLRRRKIIMDSPRILARDARASLKPTG